MRCPILHELPPPPAGKTGWPWTEESRQLPDTLPNRETWPRISIVTPSYNQGTFIEEAIRSTLLQGYPDLEYIIIDGNSFDNSVEVIRKYEPWLTYWVSEPDRGQSHAINKGLAKSTGDLFNWHNSDDVFFPGSLAMTAQAMREHPEASYAYGYRIVIDEKSDVLYDTKHVWGEQTAFVSDIETSIATLKGGVQLGGLMKRQLVLLLEGVDENLHYLMDRDLTLRLELLAPPLYNGQPVIYLREYPESKTCTWTAQRAKERLVIANKIFKQELPLSVQRVKRKSYAKAHRFAWECYASAGMQTRAVWHALLDIFYLPEESWNERYRVLENVRQRTKKNSQRWLNILVKGSAKFITRSKRLLG